MLSLSAFIFLSALSVMAEAPVVNSFTATKTAVSPEETVSITLEAHDPDCPDVCLSGCGQAISSSLTLWTASGGTLSAIDLGITSSPYTTSADWTAPAEEGVYTITVDIFDNATWMCGNRQTAQAFINISVSSSPPPVINSITASPADLDYQDISIITCSATDPSGYELIYSWSSDKGSVDNSYPSSDSTTFTASESGNYIATVTCVVTNGHGGTASESVAVNCTFWDYLNSYFAKGAPSRIAVDKDGNCAVSDTLGGFLSLYTMDGIPGNRIYPVSRPCGIAFTSDGNIITGDLDSGSALILDNDFNIAGHLGNGPGEFLKPTDIAVHPANGNIFVVDMDRNTVKVFDSSGARLFSFGNLGSGIGEFNKPLGIAVSPLTGNIFVTDRNNYRVQVFDPSGTHIRSFGSKGQEPGQFSSVSGIAFDREGYLYVVDEFQGFVQMFSEDGTYIAGISSYGNENGKLNLPVDAVVDNANRLLVTSSNKGTVEIFQLGGGDGIPEHATDVSASDVIGDNGGSILINWTKSSCDAKGVIAYEIYRKEGVSGFTLIGSVLPGTESFVDSTTTDGVYYSYMIRAHSTNYFSDSEISNSATSVNDLPPAIPSGFSVSQDASGVVTAIWNANADPDILGYHVSCDTQPGSHENSIFVGNTTAYIFSELELGTLYYISVRAEDTGFNLSGYAPEEMIKPADQIPPAIPSGFRGADKGFDNTLYFAWDENSEPDIAGYTVFYGTNPGEYTGSLFTSETHASLTSLEYTVRYYVAVAANDTSGNQGLVSSELTIEPTDSVVPLAALDIYGNVPENGFLQTESAPFSFGYMKEDFNIRFESRDISADEVEVWINGIPLGFISEHSSAEWSGWAYFNVPGESASAAANSLIFKNVNNPPSSDTWGIRNILIPADPPGLVRGITDNSIIYLNWDRSGSSGITGYNVYRYDHAADTISIANTSIINRTCFVDTYLVNGNQYSYYVAAVMDNGEETALSAPFTGTPVFSGAPSGVYDLFITKSLNDAVFGWTALSYENSSFVTVPVPEYNVLISNNPDLSGAIQFNTADNEYLSGGILNDGLNYYIRIISSDGN